MGEMQVAWSEKCETDLKTKLKRRNKTKGKSIGGFCAAFSVCAEVLNIFRPH